MMSRCVDGTMHGHASAGGRCVSLPFFPAVVEGVPRALRGAKPGSRPARLFRRWLSIRKETGLCDVRVHHLRPIFSSPARMPGGAPAAPGSRASAMPASARRRGQRGRRGRCQAGPQSRVRRSRVPGLRTASAGCARGGAPFFLRRDAPAAVYLRSRATSSHVSTAWPLSSPPETILTMSISSGAYHTVAGQSMRSTL